MAERRSRSVELQAMAIERGLAVEHSPELEKQLAHSEEELEMKPAFDMGGLQAEVVAEQRIQEGDSPTEAVEGIEAFDTTGPSEIVEPPDPEFAEDGQLGEIEIQEMDTCEAAGDDEKASFESEVPLESEEIAEAEPDESPEAQIINGPGEATVTLDQTEQVAAELPEEATVGKSEAEFVEETLPEEPVVPATPEELIEQGGDLLGDAPETIPDAEVLIAAEELVDQIGTVVDIQSLPKTQPSRVLSKVAKKESVAAKPVAEASAPDSEKVLAPAEQPKAAGPDPTASAKPKKKSKKISLLDSYFKGL